MGIIIGKICCIKSRMGAVDKASVAKLEQARPWLLGHKPATFRYTILTNSILKNKHPQVAEGRDDVAI